MTEENWMPFLSESLTQSDYNRGIRTAILYKGKVYKGKIDEIHIKIIERYRLPYFEVVTGYVNNEGRWYYQHELDLP